jgi:polar amino acid transport system substrate-binding protein
MFRIIVVLLKHPVWQRSRLNPPQPDVPAQGFGRSGWGLWLQGLTALLLVACPAAAQAQDAGAKVASALPPETANPAPGVSATPGWADSPQPRFDGTIEGPLTVGVKSIVPFVFVTDDGIPYGYSIDLWHAIADKMDVETQFKTYDSISDLLEAVRQGEVDAAIAGISITDDRESSGLDFSYPMYQAGLQLVTVDRSTIPVLRYFGYIANGATLVALVRVFIGCWVVGTLIWLLERHHNPAFKHGPVAGIGQGIWFALATLGTFGYGDVTPMKPLGRVIAVVWMGASFFILADFIASISAAYRANTPVRSLEDVYNHSVAAIKGSTAADFLRSRPLNLVELDNYDEIFAGLASQDLYAAVIDYPTAKYEMARQPQVLMAGERLNREDYGIAVQEGSVVLLEEINRDILALQQEGFFDTLDDKWFGPEAATQGQTPAGLVTLAPGLTPGDALPQPRPVLPHPWLETP